MKHLLRFWTAAILLASVLLAAFPPQIVQAAPHQLSYGWTLAWDNVSVSRGSNYDVTKNATTVCGAANVIRAVVVQATPSSSFSVSYGFWGIKPDTTYWGDSTSSSSEVRRGYYISGETYIDSSPISLTSGQKYTNQTLPLNAWDQTVGSAAGTGSITLNIWFYCDNGPTPTPTTGPTNTATATATTAATATNTPTPLSTVTAGNQVCQVGHTLKAVYAAFDYDVADKGPGADPNLKVYYGGQEGIAGFEATELWDVGQGSSGICLTKNDGVSDDKCGKVQLITGLSLPQKTAQGSGPNPITWVRFDVWQVYSAEVSITEYGYLCYDPANVLYYIVRNMGGPSHTFGDSGGSVLQYTADLPTIEMECKPSSVVQNFDLVELGTLTAGSLDANSTTNVLDATIEYTLPVPVFGSPGYASASLDVRVDGYTQTYFENMGQTTINGLTYWNNDLFEIGIIPGTTAITVHYTQEYDVSMMPVTMTEMILSVHVENEQAGGILNCDGGMELEQNVSPWNNTQQSLDYGRIIYAIYHAVNPLEGPPACESGMHVVGTHPPVLAWMGALEASDAFEYFSAPGGTVYWKMRYRSAGLAGITPNSPHVYLTEKTTGALAGDLIGLPGTYDPALVKSDWTLVTGQIDLAAGNYGVYISKADRNAAVYYDDLYFSTRPWSDTECTKEYTWPEIITPGPSPTPTNTITITTTPNGTVVVTTPSVTPTALGPSRTPRPSLTSYPSYTPWPSFTPRATTTRTITPNATSQFTITPTYGQPNPATQTPLASGTPGSNTPDPDMPPVHPGDGSGGFTGNGSSDCIRPSNWFSIGWWIDYERCLTFSWLTFGPSQRATAAAIPNQFNNYEPFGTINEFTTGVVAVRTEIASYPWNGSQAAQGVNDAINPSAPLKTGGSCASDPWNGDLGLGEPACMTIATTADYQSGCTAKISQNVPGALAGGLCFVFGVTRNIGLLPWMQFFLNIMALLMPIRLAFTIIEMRQTMSAAITTVTKEA